MAGCDIRENVPGFQSVPEGAIQIVGWTVPGEYHSVFDEVRLIIEIGRDACPIERKMCAIRWKRVNSFGGIEPDHCLDTRYDPKSRRLMDGYN